jgi:hypothetical protein
MVSETVGHSLLLGRSSRLWWIIKVPEIYLQSAKYLANFSWLQEHFTAFCRCKETVKLFRFLLSLYRPSAVCRTALSVTVQEHFTAHCRCMEAVKSFKFLLSTYSLIWTFHSVQNCAFHWLENVFICICQMRRDRNVNNVISICHYNIPNHSLINHYRRVPSHEVRQRFKGAYYFHLQRWNIIQAQKF